MNKKNVVAVVAVILLFLVGFGVYKFTGLSKKTVQNSPAAQIQKQTTLSSLKDLIAGGVSQSCSYSTEKTSGIVYMAGGKVRADITTTGTGEDAQTAIVHIVVTDNEDYIWTDGKTTGYKTPYNSNATTSPSGASGQWASLDPDTSMDYDCTPWIVDNIKFDLPKNINFMDIGKMTNQNPGDTSNSKCSYCDSLSGDGKTKCLSAFNCK